MNFYCIKSPYLILPIPPTPPPHSSIIRSWRWGPWLCRARGSSSLSEKGTTLALFPGRRPWEQGYTTNLLIRWLLFSKDPLTRAKKAVHRLVQRVGFFGILLCASVRASYVTTSPNHHHLKSWSACLLFYSSIHTLSSKIPNPLFDLAGITCGHFLVPFWTFFGATLIGKAIIKMHIQVQHSRYTTAYHSVYYSIP